MARTQKEVTVLARYAHKTNGKLNGTVTYLVKSSDGTTSYYTTLVEGKATGCSCPSHKPCYHMKGLEAKESQRWAQYRIELAKKLAEQYMTTQVVEQVAEQMVAPAKSPKVAKVIELATSAKVPTTTDLSEKGNLNTGQGFRMMR